MKKYIDYLRAQQKAVPKASDTSEEKNAQKKGAGADRDSVYNPYSKDRYQARQKQLNKDLLIADEPFEASNNSARDHDFIDETAPTGIQPKNQKKRMAGGNLASAEYSLIVQNAPDGVDDTDLIIHDNKAPRFISTLGNSNANFNTSSWLEDISQTLQDIFQHAEKNQPTDINPLYQHIRILQNQIAAMPNELDILELEVHQNLMAVRTLDNDNGDLLEKSIMMMLYTIKIGLNLKIHPEKMLYLIVASMLHHIGMVMVPHDIRNKKGKLTKEEFRHIKQAPEIGHQYLKDCQIEDEGILLAAAQASERFDGSGPLGLVGNQIAMSARLTGLLSMFEALIHFRPYRRRLLPRDAIVELVTNHKNVFDPEMLKALIEAISLYPVGTFVQLNTDEIGLVITVHDKFPLRPVIYINMDRFGNPINERKIDLKQHPNMSIKKCTYKESLDELLNRDES